MRFDLASGGAPWRKAFFLIILIPPISATGEPRFAPMKEPLLEPRACRRVGSARKYGGTPHILAFRRYNYSQVSFLRHKEAISENPNHAMATEEDHGQHRLVPIQEGQTQAPATHVIGGNADSATQGPQTVEDGQAG
jgi:hypothetical protein